eukprot:6185508-Pleurochrysis_carterae.AAC.1
MKKNHAKGRHRGKKAAVKSRPRGDAVSFRRLSRRVAHSGHEAGKEPRLVRASRCGGMAHWHWKRCQAASVGIQSGCGACGSIPRRGLDGRQPLDGGRTPDLHRAKSAAP